MKSGRNKWITSSVRRSAATAKAKQELIDEKARVAAAHKAYRLAAATRKKTWRAKAALEGSTTKKGNILTGDAWVTREKACEKDRPKKAKKITFKMELDD